MADADDLDAFFDEVEQVVATTTDNDNGADAAIEPPPKKKAKPTVVGVVVAAASEKKKILTPETVGASAPSAASTAATCTEANKPFVAAPATPSTTTTITATAASAAAIGPPPGGVGPALPPVGPLPAAAAAAAAGATKPKKGHVRTAAGKTWVDPTLDEWPDNDFRIFVGNLDPTTDDEQVWQHFARYPSLLKAKVIRDKHKNDASRGYAFVSFGDALECAKALRQMDQTWLGGRPCRLKRCNWKDRELNQVRKNEKKRQKQQKRMGLL